MRVSKEQCMKKKKLLTVLSMSFLIFGLSSCGSDDSTSSAYSAGGILYVDTDAD